MTTAAPRTPVLTILRLELHDGLRNRWLWLHAGAFAILASVLARLALPGATIGGYGAFGRSASSLVALIQLVVPLLGLTLGAQAVAGRRDRGGLRYLLSQPISRTQVFVGIYLGMAAALLATITAGFGAAGLVTGLRGGGADAIAFLRIAGLSWLLALAMLAIGLLISTFIDRAASAVGTAVFVWLVVVFLGDLGLMGSAAATRMPVSTLFLTAVANPIEAFRLATLMSFRDSVDVLGPAGSYAIDRFGDNLGLLLTGILLMWVAIPLAAGWIRFTRGTDL